VPHSVALLGLLAGGPSGVARYTSVLARAIDEVAPEFPDLALELVTTVAGAETVGARNLRVRDFGLRGRYVNRGPGRIGLEQLVTAATRADLVHFFDLSGPVLRPRRPFVTTIHDASVAYGYRSRRHAYKRRIWPFALRRASRVIAVSGFARDEAVRRLGARSDKVVVLHSGPGLQTDRVEPDPRRTPVEPFYVYVGDFAKRKNLPFLVRAFDAADCPVRLVLAGRVDDGFDSLRAAIRAARSRERIDVLVDPSDAELEALYRAAVALILPSRYEGFGFTALEAMARGCPVLASDIAATREIAGDGAMLLPLDDEGPWSDALRSVAADASVRAELRARGARTAARYSWLDTARGVCGVFLEQAGRRR
jgi:glycosyltransferase involved in cell wall biosynthesis